MLGGGIMYPGQLHANQAHGSNMPTSAYIGRQNQQLTSVSKAGHTFSAVPLEQLTPAVQQLARHRSEQDRNFLLSNSGLVS
jgi:hypothetical protein